MSSKRLAWVIGVSDYEDAPLAKCTEDAKSIRAALLSAGFEKDNIVYSGNPDIDKFDKEKEKFKGKLTTDLELVLFYFSGHGAAISNEQFLIPRGSVSEIRDSLARKSFALYENFLKEFKDSHKNVKKWIWLDACQENVFQEGEDVAFSKADLSNQKYFPENTIIFNGAYPKKFSFEGSPETPTSFFTTALLEEIPKQGVKHTDLMNAVIESVSKKTRSQQNPHMMGSFKEAFYFFPPVVEQKKIGSYKQLLNNIGKQIRDVYSLKDGLYNLLDYVNQFEKSRIDDIEDVLFDYSFIKDKTPAEYDDDDKKEAKNIARKARDIFRSIQESLQNMVLQEAA